MCLNVFLVGAAGRMGKALAEATDMAGMTVVGGLSSADIARENFAFPIFHTLEAIDIEMDAIIDFSSPSLTSKLLSAPNLEHLPLIIGTTGLDADQLMQLQNSAEMRPIVYARNFSVGVNLLAMMSAKLSATLGNDWDIEINETHHRHKQDAPSGTALLLAEAIQSGRTTQPVGSLQPLTASQGNAGCKNYTADGPRESGDVGMSVSRLGGVFGEHAVRFGSESEILSISHLALNRLVFAQGAIRAALWLKQTSKTSGLYSMQDVLGDIVSTA